MLKFSLFTYQPCTDDLCKQSPKIVGNSPALAFNSFVSCLKRAEKLSRTPLQQVLILIGLFQEIAEQIVEPGAGCLIASYVYQGEGIDQEIRDITV